MPQGGIHTVTVPGAVAGWDALRAKLGSLPLSDLLAPAIFYADDGFPVSDVIAAHWAALADKLAAEPNADDLPAERPRASRRRAVQEPRPREVAAPHRETRRGRLLRRADRRRDPRDLARERRHDDRRRSARARARMGRSDLDDLSRVDGLRAAAEHAGHRRADDAQPDGAVSARRLRLPQRPRAARDDRGEEARLRRHAALRRRHALRPGAGLGDARQGARETARQRIGAGDAARDVQPSVFDGLTTSSGQTRSTSRSSTATATSSR